MSTPPEFFDETTGEPWDWTRRPDGEPLYNVQRIMRWVDYAVRIALAYLFKRVTVTCSGDTYTGVVREIYFELGGDPYFLVVSPDRPPQCFERHNLELGEDTR